MRACDSPIEVPTMRRHRFFSRWVIVSIPFLVSFSTWNATAVAQPGDSAAVEEARERQSMQRFLSLLERNPRKGTPLDRVYGFHVERGRSMSSSSRIVTGSRRSPTTARAG